MTTRKELSEKKPAAIKVNVQQPEVDENSIVKQGSSLSDKITALAITDQDSYNVAASLLAPVKQYISYLSGIFKPQRDALKKAIEIIQEQEKKLIGPRLTFAKSLETSLTAKMSLFLIEEETRNRKKAAEEKAQKDKESAAEKAKLEKKAVKAEEKGKDSQAEQLRAQADAVTAATVSVKPAVSFAGTGTFGRNDIEIQFSDPSLFLKYLLDMNAPISDLIEFRYAGVKKYVKEKIEILEDEEVQKAPGIVVTKKKIIGSSIK